MRRLAVEFHGEFLKLEGNGWMSIAEVRGR